MKKTSHNKPLDYDELADAVDLMLWMGQLLMQFGGDSQRIQRNVSRLGKAMGVEMVDIFISHNSIIITAGSEVTFRTKIRKVFNHGVNMSTISEISIMSWKALRENLSRDQIRDELQRISSAPRVYSRWLVVFMVGLACASFSKLFGGDWPVFGITFLAAAAAMFVRQELHARHFNTYMIIIGSSLTATTIASMATVFNIGEQPTLALAASVLLLVPGVPMINSVEDIVDGYTNVGVTRALIGVVISLCIALGLLLVMGIFGIEQL